MGLGDGATHLQDQAEALLDREVSPIRGIGETLPALDVLHREVGASVSRETPVDEPGDGRVVQTRQDLALLLESRQDRGRVHALLDQLEGDGLLEPSLDAFRPMDGAHPAHAEERSEAERSDDLALGTVDGLEESASTVGFDRSPRRPRLPCVDLEERQDLLVEGRVAVRFLLHVGEPTGRIQVQGLSEDLFDPTGIRTPAHESVPVPSRSSLRSHAFAKVVSRSTVRFAIPRAAAVSSTSRPPK